MAIAFILRRDESNLLHPVDHRRRSCEFNQDMACAVIGRCEDAEQVYKCCVGRLEERSARLADLIQCRFGPTQANVKDVPKHRDVTPGVNEGCPPQVVLNHCAGVPRQVVFCQEVDDSFASGAAPQLIEVIADRIGPKAFQDFVMAALTRFIDRAGQELVILIVVIRSST
ncbi:MAG TPA: hypothetical protein VGM50_02535 [Gemmatimonadaceae bacterium]